MADKYKRGIPNDFVFDPVPVANLGDYLDEVHPLPALARAKVKPPRPEKTAAPELAPQPTANVSPAAESPPPLVAAGADAKPKAPSTPVAQSNSHPSERTRLPRHTGPRREINMSPETLRMSDDLLDLIRGGSGQRDTKANELIHALVLLAFEVKDALDPFAIPKRGRWGTPTARAYPIELKNAFLHALLKKHA